MKKQNTPFSNLLFTLMVLLAAFCINLWIEAAFDAKGLAPMLFVLSVFMVAWRTHGYFWGIIASLIGMFAVNYAFTYPYYAFDFELTPSLISAIVMLAVAVMTSALTTQIKNQEMMRAEAEMEKMRANLLRAISHDLRTPLTSIYGSCSAIIENYDSLKKSQQLKLLDEIRSDAEWLTRMVENLLSVTRIDGEKVQVIKTPTVLEELIDTTLVKFRKRHPHQEVEVIIPDEFISIPMDALLIEQVLVNILENAVHHAVGLTHLSLTVRTEGKNAVFEIADNGSGIPPERLENLFNGMLHQTDSPSDGTRSNMGIGLSVCATIIRAHGGVIRAENLITGGALFRFALEMETENNEQ